MWCGEGEASGHKLGNFCDARSLCKLSNVVSINSANYDKVWWHKPSSQAFRARGSWEIFHGILYQGDYILVKHKIASGRLQAGGNPALSQYHISILIFQNFSNFGTIVPLHEELFCRHTSAPGRKHLSIRWIDPTLHF